MLVASVELLKVGVTGVGESMQRVETRSVRRYSTRRRRSLIAVVARRAMRRVNGSASMILVKPFVVLAARVLGPGPTRLKLVKLAHNLDQNGLVVEPVEGPHGELQGPAVQPTQRAA